MSDEAVYLGPVDMSPIQRAMNRMRGAQQAWRAQNSDDQSGECIRADIVYALRAIAVFERSADEYLMVFGIGGPNPCRSKPVELPTWEQMRRGS